MSIYASADVMPSFLPGSFPYLAAAHLPGLTIMRYGTVDDHEHPHEGFSLLVIGPIVISREADGIESWVISR